MNNENEKYKSKDYYLSSVLYSQGVKLHSTEWIGRSCYFLFEEKSRCLEIINKYYSGELLSDPKSVIESLKTIKSIIFNK